MLTRGQDVTVLTRGQKEICDRVNSCADKGTGRNM